MMTTTTTIMIKDSQMMYNLATTWGRRTTFPRTGVGASTKFLYMHIL